VNLALIIVTIAVTTITGLAVFGLFFWGAKKDGEDQARIDARVTHRRWGH
jgi:hypothetical protein